ncbi:ran-binding protein 3-like isoform X2 [Latimeria chalumnae]|uniref:ran-binding protein 3-like isoform X2 n=1 Tax=Latimeria chalumnae TaxID=7897 RepID=UPI0003C13EAF|nr:PREDICTED: ran-binding protein 3-like isoform X3 [Latimeria chalumnae]|eukprot:XP_006000667.1 PREDICTED: ran-binding protein 3-like isoform X3 [Latimeria chalumnae]
MRSQQVSPSQVTSLYAGIEPFCANSITKCVCPVIRSKSKAYSYKGKNCVTYSLNGGKTFTTVSTMVRGKRCRNPFYNLNSRDCHFFPLDTCSKGKPELTPPLFVFQKTERLLKRPAVDPVSKDVNGASVCAAKRGRSSSFTFSQSLTDSNCHDTRARSISFNSTPGLPSCQLDCHDRRARSSSFTFLPTFPPSQPVERNNFFMPSTLCNMNADSTDLETGRITQDLGRNIIRSAVLQPPEPRIIVQPTAYKKELEPYENVFTAFQRDEKTTQQCAFESSWSLLEESKTSKDNSITSSLFSYLDKARNCKNEEMAVADNITSDFVFGENMSERVLNPYKSYDFNCETADKGITVKMEMSCGEQEPLPCAKASPVRKPTLMESAATYTAAAGGKCLLERIEVITGEEAESNVLQINCKLFVFDKPTQSYIERGRGVLRLNDMVKRENGALQSRLVVRSQGSLRLILNTKLWAQMQINKANRKSLCITATDIEDQSVKVFLIQASAKDILRLYAAIHHRLVALRITVEHDAESSLTEPESEPGTADKINDSEDEEDVRLTRMCYSGSGHSGWMCNESVVCI